MSRPVGSKNKPKAEKAVQVVEGNGMNGHAPVDMAEVAKKIEENKDTQ